MFERKLRARVSAKEDGGDEAEEESRGESTMPERFRYLNKEAPDPPVRWPWFLGKMLHSLCLSFLLCFVRNR